MTKSKMFWQKYKVVQSLKCHLEVASLKTEPSSSQSFQFVEVNILIVKTGECFLLEAIFHQSSQAALVSRQQFSFLYKLLHVPHKSVS